jgi:heat shock protein HslJ
MNSFNTRNMTKKINWKAFVVCAFLLAFIQPAKAAELIKLIVKEDRVTCTGAAPQTCYQVKYKNSRDWEYFYGSIGGFKYKEGYRYTLMVYRSSRANVPADASAYVYKLKSIVKKEWYGQPRPTGITAIAAQQWQLIAVNGKKVQNSRISFYLDPAQRRFSGSDGCNTYFGNFTANDRNQSLSLGEAASTLKACLDKTITHMASQYNQVIRLKEFTYKMQGQILQLSHKGKIVLEFRNAPLTGNGNTGSNNQVNIWSFIAKHKWRLIQMNGKSQDQSPAFMIFDTDKGRISGNAGCNNFFGSYTGDDRNISFGSMGSTRMACMDQERSKLESAFLKLISDQKFTFDVADQTLNLYQNNRLVLMFGRDNSLQQQGQGLRGTVNFMEGNHMPGTGPRSGSTKPVAREILIYEKTNQNQVTQENGTIFYTRIATKKIASVWSDSSGRYEVSLPPGTYSVFVKEAGKFYANSSDGEGYINTITVNNSEFTDFDIAINYKAAY